MKTRTQLDKELYEIVYGKDLKIMYQELYRLFKKRKLENLSNDQMETLICWVKQKYKEDK